ncbi:MAG: hypothetical protein ACK4WF_00555 [Candidatus Brocadiales bacterium]
MKPAVSKANLYDGWLKYGTPIVLVVLGLTSRIPFTGRYLGEWDEVGFALALRDYDIVAQQPHFPGYPVYVWLSQMAMGLVKEDIGALGLVSAFFGSLAVLPLYYLALYMYSGRVAVLVAFLFLTNPVCWLYSERPLAEATGIFFLLLYLCLLFMGMRESVNPWIPPLGAFFMGITLGARLDYFPFLSGLFYVLTYAHWRYSIFRISCFLGAFALGVVVWLFPFVLMVGQEVLSHQALDFAQGHFTDWGGSIVTVPNPSVRLGHLLWDVFPAGLGLWWIDLSYMRLIPSVCLLSGLYAFLRENEHDLQRRFILAVLLPYLLWVFFAQNVEKPRHVLPLIPLLLLAASAGMLRESPINMSRLGLLVLTVIILGATSLKLVHHYSQSRPPLMQLVSYVQSAPSNFDQSSTRIYCGETKRLFEYYAPGWDARRVRDWEGLRYDYRASLCPPPNLLVTSEVQIENDPSGSPEAGLRHIKKFKGDRYIYAPYHEVALLGVDSHGI